MIPLADHGRQTVPWARASRHVRLYSGSQSWVLPPSALREIERFHVKVVRHLTGMCPRKVQEVWVYPHSADVLAAAHLQTIDYYIQRCCHTVTGTIQYHEILKECRRVERRRGTPTRLFWCGKDMEEPEWREYGKDRGKAPSSPPHWAPCRTGATDSSRKTSGSHAAGGRGGEAALGRRPY